MIELSKPVPLYITYLTLRPGPDGKVVQRSDAYGKDRAALRRYEADARDVAQVTERSWGSSPLRGSARSIGRLRVP